MNDTAESQGLELVLQSGNAERCRSPAWTGDRERLEAVVADRNRAQKHLWRA